MKLIDITKSFQTKKILQIEELVLSEKQVHGLLGANGAGKSTFIKIIMGLVFPDTALSAFPVSVSMLPEIPCLPLNLTAYQVVAYACAGQSSGVNTSDLLQEVQLKKDFWHKPIQTYSKGMKQRTAIAYALAGSPQWLILDEPMSGLDAMGRRHMLDVFEKRKKRGLSILMCSHAVTDLVRLCDQVHIMAQGQVCETVAIQKHSMQEVEELEKKLIHWSKDNALD